MSQYSLSKALIGLICMQIACSGTGASDKTPQEPGAALTFQAVRDGAQVSEGEMRWVNISVSLGKSTTRVIGEQLADPCELSFLFEFVGGPVQGNSFALPDALGSNGSIGRPGASDAACQGSVMQMWTATRGSLLVERVTDDMQLVRIALSDVQMEALPFAENAGLGSFSVSGWAQGGVR